MNVDMERTKYDLEEHDLVFVSLSSNAATLKKFSSDALMGLI
jgi:hypothetical protein